MGFIKQVLLLLSTSLSARAQCAARTRQQSLSPATCLPQADEWPNFRWADFSPLLVGDYQGWGYFMPQNIKEPNNLMPPELCVGANYTEAYKGAWAWADTNCGDAYPYMCMNTRERAAPVSCMIHRVGPWACSPGRLLCFACERGGSADRAF